MVQGHQRDNSPNNQSPATISHKYIAFHIQMSLTHPPPVLVLLLQGLGCPKSRVTFKIQLLPFKQAFHWLHDGHSMIFSPNWEETLNWESRRLEKHTVPALNHWNGFFGEFVWLLFACHRNHSIIKPNILWFTCDTDVGGTTWNNSTRNSMIVLFIWFQLVQAEITLSSFSRISPDVETVCWWFMASADILQQWAFVRYSSSTIRVAP